MNFYILDSNFDKVDLIDTYESAIWTDRYLEPGDFELYIKISGKIPSKIKIGRYLTQSGSKHTMIIEEIKIETDIEEGNKLIVTGRSLESILDRRIVWKKTTFKENANVQEVIKELLNKNIINPEVSKRKIKNFVFKESNDFKVKDKVLEEAAEYLGDNLLDVIQKLCETNSLGFKIILNKKTKELEFSLYAGKNRTIRMDSDNYVVFSPKTDNLLNTNYDEDIKPYKNVAMCLGPEEDKYEKVEMGGTANPSEEGWYKLWMETEGPNKGEIEWIKTEDVVKDPNVQYYAKSEEKTRLQAVAGSASGLSRREVYNDCSSADRDGETTYTKVTITGHVNPSEEGWYKKYTYADSQGEVQTEWIKTSDESPMSGVDYYQKDTHTKGDELFKKFLLQMGKEKLTETKRKETYDGETAYATSMYRYDKHFSIGDVVRIVNEYGFEGKCRITEYIFSDDVSDRLKCYPTFEMVEED